jgi:uncharacterized membrane protein YraQ (UPF0718 family)
MTALALSLGNGLKRLDRALLAILVVLLALAAFAPDQLPASLGFTLESLVEVLPFLAFSILLAAYAKASGSDRLIAKAFSGRLAVMVVAASLMGALSPFCSCGVIPLIAALLAMGVPLPAVMAFWLASPIMDPSMFVLTTGTLGLTFALYKTAAAIAIGLLGGYGTALLQRLGGFEQPLREGVGDGGCGAAPLRSGQPPVWRFWQEEKRRGTFKANLVSNSFFLGKWLALAFLLESVMLAYVPAETVADLIGGEGLWPVLAATLVGVPAYLNGYAALPLVGGLIEQGMAPGAGMAFLLAGGVSSIPAAIAVFALARLPVFLAYLGFAFLGSFALGLAFGALPL